MTVFEMFLSIWLFLYRLKRKVRALTESDFNRITDMANYGFHMDDV